MRKRHAQEERGPKFKLHTTETGSSLMVAPQGGGGAENVIVARFWGDVDIVCGQKTELWNRIFEGGDVKGKWSGKIRPRLQR